MELMEELFQEREQMCKLEQEDEMRMQVSSIDENEGEELLQVCVRVSVARVHYHGAKSEDVKNVRLMAKMDGGVARDVDGTRNGVGIWIRKRGIYDGGPIKATVNYSKGGAVVAGDVNGAGSRGISRGGMDATPGSYGARRNGEGGGGMTNGGDGTRRGLGTEAVGPMVAMGRKNAIRDGDDVYV